jgi:hypothetical protein
MTEIGEIENLRQRDSGQVYLPQQTYIAARPVSATQV